MRDGLLEPRNNLDHRPHVLFRQEAVRSIAKPYFDTAIPKPANPYVDFGARPAFLRFSKWVKSGENARGNAEPFYRRTRRNARAQRNVSFVCELWEQLRSIPPVWPSFGRGRCPRWLPRRLKVEAGLRVETARWKFLER